MTSKISEPLTTREQRRRPSSGSHVLSNYDLAFAFNLLEIRDTGVGAQTQVPSRPLPSEESRKVTFAMMHSSLLPESGALGSCACPFPVALPSAQYSIPVWTSRLGLPGKLLVPLSLQRERDVTLPTPLSFE